MSRPRDRLGRYRRETLAEFVWTGGTFHARPGTMGPDAEMNRGMWEMPDLPPERVGEEDRRFYESEPEPSTSQASAVWTGKRGLRGTYRAKRRGFVENGAMAVANGVRVRPPFDFIPAAVGAGAGLTAGVLRTYGSGLPAWRMGVYEGGLIGVGVLAHFMGWNADLAYGLQVAGAYGLAEQIAPAVKAKKPLAVFSDIATLSEGDIAVLEQGARAHTSSGCSACAAAALRNPDTAPARSVPAPQPARPRPREEAAGIL